MIFVMGALAASCTATRASELFQEALYHANEGRLDHAIDLWSKFIQRHPKSYAAYANRGAAYLWAGHVYQGSHGLAQGQGAFTPFRVCAATMAVFFRKCHAIPLC